MLATGLSEKNLIPYDYPTIEEFEQHGIQVIYLGWFLGDWSLLNNGMISGLSGLRFRHDPPQNTGDLYGVTALDEDWVTLNQMIKYYKFGFGRATDYANEMIRLGTIDRNAGIELVQKYDGVCSDTYIQNFCDYIGITPTLFWEKILAVTNKDLFDVSGNQIKPKFTVGEGL